MTPAVIVGGAALLKIAIPLLQPLIDHAVTAVENVFKKPGSGPLKMSTVETFISAIANGLSGSGDIPGTLDIASIISMIEATVQAKKAAGTLGATTTTTLPVAGQGQTIKLSGTFTIG